MLVSTRDKLSECTLAPDSKVSKRDSLSRLGEVVEANWEESRVTGALTSSLGHPFAG